MKGSGRELGSGRETGMSQTNRPVKVERVGKEVISLFQYSLCVKGQVVFHYFQNYVS
jgi:hypothetical protein